MKKRKIQVAVVLFIAAVTLLSSSFGRQVDIEERVLCHAMGVDYENGEYNVSLQVFKTQSMGSDTPLDVSQSNIQTVNCKGRSIRDAIEGCQYQIGREIFFGHLQIICFNKNIDLSSPEELFSFAIKDKNVFLGVELCLAENTAEELMNVQLTRGTMSSENFTQVIKMGVRNGITVECRLIDLLSCIRSPQYIAMPVISIKQPLGDFAESHEEKSAEQQEPLLEIKKTALIRKGTVLESYLSHADASGCLWLTGKAEQYSDIIEYNGSPMDVRITSDSHSLKLDNENGRLVCRLKLTVLAHTSLDIRDEKSSDQVAALVKQRLEENITGVWNKALYENRTDIFDVWRLFRHKYPQSYLKYADRLDEVLGSVELETDITCHKTEHILGKRCGNSHYPAVFRALKSHFLAVESLTAYKRACLAIKVITQERIAHKSRVYSYLVRSAGFKKEVHKRKISQLFAYKIIRCGILSVSPHTAFYYSFLLPCDRRTDTPAAVGQAFYYSNIGLFKAFLEHCGASLTFCHKHTAARVAVKAVDRSKSEAWIKCGKKISQRIVTMLY